MVAFQIDRWKFLIALMMMFTVVRPLAAAPRADETLQNSVSSNFVEVKRVASWILHSDDNQGVQFIIIDKVNARLFLFDRAGEPVASTRVLLGLARGDDSPPGIGSRKLSAIKPAERITPAGRFVSGAGEDVGGQDLIWIDYDAAIALHRASDRKPGASPRSRADRLSTDETAEKRISLGCVNVSTDFYDRYIKPTFGVSKGVIYILPETRSASAEFHIPV